MARLRAKLVALVLALDRLTVNTASAPSSTVTLLAAGVAALLTVLMVATFGVPLATAVRFPLSVTVRLIEGKVPPPLTKMAPVRVNTTVLLLMA